MMMIASAMQKFLLAPLERMLLPLTLATTLRDTARYYPLPLPPPLRYG